jgi:hypothetical protein
MPQAKNTPHTPTHNPWAIILIEGVMRMMLFKLEKNYKRVSLCMEAPRSFISLITYRPIDHRP